MVFGRSVRWRVVVIHYVSMVAKTDADAVLAYLTKSKTPCNAVQGGLNDSVGVSGHWKKQKIKLHHRPERAGILRIFRHGYSLAVRGENHGIRGVRGVCSGWTPGVARANMNFLKSVDIARVRRDVAPVFGFSFTTGTPMTWSEYLKARRAFYRWSLRGGGVVYDCCEWQRREAIHLHGFFAIPGVSAAAAVDKWVNITRRMGLHVNHIAQKITPIYDDGGWLNYCSKHLFGGAKKDQRKTPPGYDGGRVWHYSRNLLQFCVRDELHVPAQYFCRLRRGLVRCSAAKVRENPAVVKKALRDFVNSGADVSGVVKRRIKKFVRKLYNRARNLGRRNAFIWRGVQGWLDFGTVKRLADGYAVPVPIPIS